MSLPVPLWGPSRPGLLRCRQHLLLPSPTPLSRGQQGGAGRQRGSGDGHCRAWSAFSSWFHGLAGHSVPLSWCPGLTHPPAGPSWPHSQGCTEQQRPSPYLNSGCLAWKHPLALGSKGTSGPSHLWGVTGSDEEAHAPLCQAHEGAAWWFQRWTGWQEAQLQHLLLCDPEQVTSPLWALRPYL